MTINTYPLIEEAVLIITPELAAIINSTGWCPEDNRPNPAELTKAQLIEEYGDIAEAFDNLMLRDVEGVYTHSEFVGKATHLVEKEAYQEHEDSSYAGEYLCYIIPDRKISLFTAAYQDIDELMKEFKKKLTEQEIDLRGFRLVSCVCSLRGIYFC